MTPSETDSKGRLKLEVKRWLCGRHLESVERDMDWQKRRAAGRSQRRQRLKKLQEVSTLFDAPAKGSRFGDET